MPANQLRIAIPKELTSSEQRVALIPAMVQEISKLGCAVLIEKNAGVAANYADEQYENVQFYSDVKKLYQDADIILKVQPPLEHEVAHYKKNCIIVSFLFPAWNPKVIAEIRDRHVTSFAIENIPRISRAQTMDALSSQATISGYKAVLIAANMSSRFFPMLTTAAGTIKPTQVLVIGAGVAGLQAIATAKRLGAIVYAYDIRAAAREQVESLGAKMIAIDLQADAKGGYARELNENEKIQQQQVLADAIAKAEIIISTALIPGKPAPKIITKAMVELMSPGSLIVDIAAEAGGNCELTIANEKIIHQGVTILGPTNLPSLLARDASMMYSKNITHFLKLLIKEGKIAINWEDEIIAQSVLTHAGVIKHQPTYAIIEGN
ncbi:MAG: Re/Si-specific NAD(P)(+) transhydrogenase subunit alpha [Gammaproteobacteria bacterium]